jgi:polyketide synthase PksN
MLTPTTQPEPATQSHSAALRLVQEVLAQFVSERDGVAAPHIDPSSPVTAYAANSVQMVQVHGRLEDAFGRPIAASALFDYETVAALAEHLSDEG